MLLFQPAHAQNQPVQAYINGNTLYSQKNYDAAITNYQTAVQLSPRFWQAYQGLGNCYYAKGNTSSALYCYQRALDLNPNDPYLPQIIQTLNNTLAATSNTTSSTNDSAAGSVSDYGSVNRNLPRKRKVVFEIEDSDWIGGWNDLQTYFSNQITTTDTVVGVKLGIGAAYSVTPYFQFGAKFQYLEKTPQVITSDGLTATYNETALGGAAEAEFTLPTNNGTNFVSSLQVGYYSLVGTNLTASGLFNGTANFSGTAPGFMVTAGMEFVMDSEKTWALDLGLDYQYLRFASLTDTPQLGTPFVLKNPDGSNAYFDFSGFGLELEARFF
jgi:tetratricopeptide (TPR) repeat protein